MRPLIILKMGGTLPELRPRRGDYEDWIAAGLGAGTDVRVLDARRLSELPAPDGSAAVVVTGSSAMVSEREPWSERAAAWLADSVAAGAPVLGICYGHQLLAHALGGHVARNPRGREIGSVEITLLPEARDDALFTGLPPRFVAQVTHLESALELPAGARRLAESPGDPNQAFARGERVWGVQFHPEFDADVIRAYLVARREILRGEGLDPARLEGEVRESPHAAALLARFAALAAT